MKTKDIDLMAEKTSIETEIIKEKIEEEEENMEAITGLLVMKLLNTPRC